jgi:glycosyltransferase involved in cell wall biosynthesis
MAKINWVCFGNASGYSQAAQDMILALDAAGHDVRVQYLLSRGDMPQTGLTRERREKFRSLVNKERTDDHIQVYHCIPSAQHNIKPTRRNVGYGMFETFQPPNQGPHNWIAMLNRNDAIITPSQFNYHIFAHEKIEKPLFYVPCCYDVTQFNDQVEPLEKYDRFTFLFFGTWRVRKGYPQLLEAFCREFSASDNVQLVIKTDKVEKAKSYLEGMRKNLGLDKKEIAPILFEHRVFDDVSLPRFLKSVNCLISPTLGEGFGLPGLQCMALGVPVAITDFSGCKDYANDQTCTLVRHSGYVLHPSMDSLPQFENRKWAHVPTSEVSRVMRHVLGNQAEILMKAEFAKQFVRQEFCYEQAERRFAEMLRTTFNV